MTPRSQPFLEHLSELRSRFLSCVSVFLVGSVFGYLLHGHILTALIQPLSQPIFYANPAGGFDFVLKISFFFGFLVTLPVFIYHTVRFTEPALPKKIPGLLVTILTSSTLLLLLGMSFAYFVSLPEALFFLNKFGTDQIQALISTSEYFTFVTSYLLGFGLVFQLPLVLLVINSIQKISIRRLLEHERWVLLISFVIAAFLTPTPDIFNQLTMAIPLIMLYQVSMILIWIVNNNKLFKKSIS